MIDILPDMNERKVSAEVILLFESLRRAVAPGLCILDSADPNEDPYSGVVVVEVPGGPSPGSGFFIRNKNKKNTIITAGHVIRSARQRKHSKPVAVTVYVKRDGNKPSPTYSGMATTHSKMFLDDRYDYAIIHLDTDVEDVYRFDLADGGYKNGGLNVKGTVSGYPQSLQYKCQVMDCRKIIAAAYNCLYYNMYTTEGQSGGPVFAKVKTNDWAAVGIHTRDGSGIQVTEDVLDWVKKH